MRVKLAVQTSKIGIFEVDFATGLALYNREMYEIYKLQDGDEWFRAGIPPETFGGSIDEWIQTVIPEDRPTVLAMLERAKSETGVLQYDYRTVLPSGEMLYLTSCAQVIRDANGALTGAIGTTVDVTRHRELRQALAHERDRLELATQVGGLGVWELDLAKQSLAWDARTFELFGLDPSSFQPSVPGVLAQIVAEEREEIERRWQCALEGRVAFEAEFRIVHEPSGEIRHLRAQSRVLFDKDNEASSVVGITWDVTSERRAAEVLITAKEAAEAGERAKSEFMASISHEIRTPMNGVLGMIELLFDSSLTAPQREMVRVMRKSGEHLLELINDILDYAKLEAGQMRLFAAPFALRPLLQDVVSLFQPLARQKGLTLSAELADAITLSGDAGRIEQIISNLIDNAIKFTEAGSVNVHVSSKLAGERTRLLRIEVIDTGIGIPARTHAQLFQRFTQVDQADRRRFGGSGLGLVISRELARAMGGTLGFESREGSGSTFWFEALPPEPDSSESRSTTPAVQSRKARAMEVLLVEDNEANQRVGRMLLEHLGHHVRVAENGAVALRVLAEQPFDCVLMDCQMPELDGYETARRIRSEPGPNAVVPIIALTAAGMAGDRERCLAAGMNDYMLKPVRRQELHVALTRAGLLSRSAGDDVPVLDEAQLAQLRRVRLPSGESLLTNLVGSLRSELPEWLRTLHAHVDASDADAARALVRRMIDGCDSIGARRLRAVLEGAAQTSWHTRLEQLEAAREQLEAALRDLSTD